MTTIRLSNLSLPRPRQSGRVFRSQDEREALEEATPLKFDRSPTRLGEAGGQGDRPTTERSARSDLEGDPRGYNGEYFQQHEGTAMGNSLSPFIANLFMSKFETEVKDKFEYFPRVWFRYVDDIFAYNTFPSLSNYFEAEVMLHK
ncbi:hypothetical protein NQ318_013830 [Aromia moschata]|uniref:Reverse transcriptase domain-containing protein n=1 Tax=Aromia moschata TaxID=1265417 RepID=A0AAV8ZAX8_9CUCU|nr:hypothetical protein NQ318_013830 [Aromia moschata]